MKEKKEKPGKKGGTLKPLGAGDGDDRFASIATDPRFARFPKVRRQEHSCRARVPRAPLTHPVRRRKGGLLWTLASRPFSTTRGSRQQGRLTRGGGRRRGERRRPPGRLESVRSALFHRTKPNLRCRSANEGLKKYYRLQDDEAAKSEVRRLFSDPGGQIRRRVC